MIIRTMLIALVCVSLAGVAAGDDAAAVRPVEWAQPVSLEGVPNLHRVSDTLFRSAQPTAEGMKKLKRMGIKTVVNLRGFHSDEDEIGETGLGYEHIGMHTWHPKKEDAVRFLRVVTDPDRVPVLVHCLHGADRTGAMCALYRIAIQGWSKQAAITEMTDGGFCFHGIWINLPDWIEDLDIQAIRQEAEITAMPDRAGSPLF